MITLPPEIAEKLPTAMKMPEGTLQFSVAFEIDFFDTHLPGGLVFEQVAGLHYFRLERTDDSRIKFYRAAPSVGTQMSVADISSVSSAMKVMIFLVWSPVEAKIHIGPAGVKGAKLVTGESIISDKNFMIDRNGSVYEVGSPGVSIKGIRVIEGEKVTLTPSAYDYWQETKGAISSLLLNHGDEDYASKTIKSNAAFIFLVTGFESYCKTRVYELEREGVVLLWSELENKAGITRDQLLGDTTSYFQSTENSKKIWKTLTGISIAELDPAGWEVMLPAFKFRHKIAHVSPILSIMNEGASGGKLLFSSNEIVNAVDACDSVVEKVHTQTLKLR